MKVSKQATNHLRCRSSQSVALGLTIAEGRVGLALLAGRYVKPLLYQVSDKDPTTFVVVVVTLLVVAVVASFVPALRASRVDPNVALRTD